MTLMIRPEPDWDTTQLLVCIMTHLDKDERVQFLVEPGCGEKVVARLRVALSRSRNRNRARNRKVKEFTLRHSLYPHTDSEGKRHTAIVMWRERNRHHRMREVLQDIMEPG